MVKIYRSSHSLEEEDDILAAAAAEVEDALDLEGVEASWGDLEREAVVVSLSGEWSDEELSQLPSEWSW
jgi:hypothetical protein